MHKSRIVSAAFRDNGDCVLTSESAANKEASEQEQIRVILEGTGMNIGELEKEGLDITACRLVRRCDVCQRIIDLHAPNMEHQCKECETRFDVCARCPVTRCCPDGYGCDSLPRCIMCDGLARLSYEARCEECNRPLVMCGSCYKAIEYPVCIIGYGCQRDSLLCADYDLVTENEEAEKQKE